MGSLRVGREVEIRKGVGVGREKFERWEGKSLRVCGKFESGRGSLRVGREVTVVFAWHLQVNSRALSDLR